MASLSHVPRRMVAAVTTIVTAGAVAFAVSAGGATASGTAVAAPGSAPTMTLAAPGSVLNGHAGRAAGVHIAAASSPSISRLQGANRFDTAAQIAETPGGSSANVILANGLTTADALAGAYLAGQLKAPILLTDTNTTPPETLAALSKLQAQNVYVLGGALAISDAQIAALGQLTSTSSAGGHLKVTRLAGADRFATAAVIDTTPPASAVGTIGGLPTALVANGLRFPDALAGGAVAAGAALPMVLTDGTQLSVAAGQTLKTLGIKQVEVLGGTAAVSTAVSDAISAMGITVNRISGADRSETAFEIATFAGEQAGFAASGNCATDPTTNQNVCVFSNMYVARGDNAGGGVDALALGPLAGSTKTPIMLTASPEDPSGPVYLEASLSAATAVLQGVRVVGGPLALAPAIVTFLTVATGGGAHPTFNATPTSVAPGGTITISDNGNPCPAAPAGNNAFNAAVLIPLANGTTTTTSPSSTTSSSTSSTSSTSTTVGATTTTTGGVGSGGTIDIFTGPAPLAGGPWSGMLTLPSSTVPGQYALVASCAVDFAPGDPIQYSYQDYTPIVLTVS